MRQRTSAVMVRVRPINITARITELGRVYEIVHFLCFFLTFFFFFGVQHEHARMNEVRGAPVGVGPTKNGEFQSHVVDVSCHYVCVCVSCTE